uniref:Uncharacterized protein n=1 Tax=Meloidogyne javanica TaxID=6303 RepID=A0A915MJM4_MELJA
MFAKRKGGGNFGEGSSSKKIQKGKAKVVQKPPKYPPKPIVPQKRDSFSLPEVVKYYENIAKQIDFYAYYNYNEHANIEYKREFIMHRFTQHAQTMSTDNFKNHFEELSQIDLGDDNNVNSLLGLVRAELAKLK